MKNLIMLEVGDCEHGQSVTVLVDTVLSTNELYALYKKGTYLLGFDLLEDVANYYGENTLTKQQFKALEEHLILEVDDLYSFDEDCLYLDVESYVKAFLGICKLGTGLRERFDAQVVYVPHMHIGGEGLLNG